jgi:hypothetical protein
MTPLSEFYDYMRLTLGDLYAEARLIEDSQLAVAVRGAVARVQIAGLNYALTPDRNEIAPEVTEPNDWMLLCCHGCLPFARNLAEGGSFRTRALAESRQGKKELLWALENEIHRLENRTMFGSWQDLAGYAAGMTGSEVWWRLAVVKAAGGCRPGLSRWEP